MVNRDIDTGGGTVVGGDVATGGGAMTGRDRIAGQVGEHPRDVAIGKDIRQEDHGNHFDFDFRRTVHDEVEDGMGEIARLIREFYSRIALLEYRLAEQEKRFNAAAVIIGIALAAILWKLYFGG